MASIDRWVLVDENDREGDHEFESYQEARDEAERRGCAIVERHYEYDDSELREDLLPALEDLYSLLIAMALRNPEDKPAISEAVLFSYLFQRFR